ncbi:MULTISPECIES: hypothetical protein [unclassified Okeania]|uniref:hypothetical protein n=1 Tax=unclassified Okeania TaxID=2634635 RepID=UPI0013B8DFE3|nr:MULTISPECIES: hypothetical protein [unclassified Okeania]NET19483.1 hypothetical protein [Okeania sp. SIO1H5]NET93283.1 hypothetical protein [Okeania sp. SIO1H2]
MTTNLLETFFLIPQLTSGNFSVFNHWCQVKEREVISCPVASVLYSKGKEEGRGKKEEGRGKSKEKGRRLPSQEKNLNFL